MDLAINNIAGCTELFEPTAHTVVFNYEIGNFIKPRQLSGLLHPRLIDFLHSSKPDQTFETTS